MLTLNTVYCADCIKLMNDIDDKSIDMILCDLPYGITSRNKWDVVIPFDDLWAHYNRIIKDNGVIALFGSQPFSSALIMSNSQMFKYELIYEKHRPVGFLNAKKQPLRSHENILIFYKHQCTYNPQGVIFCKPKINHRSTTGTNYNGAGATNIQTITNYPRSIIKVPQDAEKLHPTQKPLALCEYLIKTYTNEGDVVLDNCAGSGTTGIACKRTHRNFVMIEKEQKYCDIINTRLSEDTYV